VPSLKQNSIKSSRHIRLPKWIGWSLAALIVVLSVTLVPLCALRWSFSGPVPIAWYASLAILCGELVGFSEITTRYRDEPLRAMFNRFGISYLLINGFLSGCAFWLVRAHAGSIFPSLKDSPLMSAVVAGFGAMTVLRSKLFIFRTEDGKEIPIGPDLVITSILRIMDRKIDRLRASRRQQLVFDLAQRIAKAAGVDSSFENANSFVLISLASFQNLSTEEKEQISATTGKTQGKIQERASSF
jgi:hypothetical protein